MEWIAKNIQVILAVAGAIAYWLNSRREAAAQAEAEREAELRKSQQPASMAEGDADDEMRAEQVREEIRRKIAERRGEQAPAEWSPPPLMPEPEEERTFRSPPIEEPPEMDVPPPVLAPARTRQPEPAFQVASETLEASLVRQELLAQELQSLNEQRVLASRRAAVVAEGEAVIARRDLAGNELRHDLRDPRSLRRAMVLREVLGPPVAMR
jgi:hypothetical protein